MCARTSSTSLPAQPSSPLVYFVIFHSVVPDLDLDMFPFSQWECTVMTSTTNSSVHKTKTKKTWALRLINLKIPVLVRSLNSNYVELSWYLDGRLFKCCLSAASNP